MGWLRRLALCTGLWTTRLIVSAVVVVVAAVEVLVVVVVAADVILLSGWNILFVLRLFR